MRIGDWLPKRDSDLTNWVANFTSVASDHLQQLGIVQQDITPIEGEKMSFDIAIGDNVTKQAFAKQATSVKNTTRKELVGLLRPLVRRIQEAPGMNNDLRNALGLPVRSEVRTTGEVGEEVPVVYLETLPGTIIVHFGTNPGNEQMNGKPVWAKGCNIYRMKNGEDDFSLIGLVSASPFFDTIEGPAASYTYYAEYRGTRITDVGQSSIPATIAASGLLAA